MTAIVLARIGALLYIGWSVFHFMAAYAVYSLAIVTPQPIVQARVLQTAFYLVAFAVAGALVAILLNWKNSRSGFWLNAIILGVADIPFVLFVLIPVLIPLFPGVAGPLLYVLALIFSGIARSKASAEVAP